MSQTKSSLSCPGSGSQSEDKDQFKGLLEALVTYFNMFCFSLLSVLPIIPCFRRGRGRRRWTWIRR